MFLGPMVPPDPKNSFKRKISAYSEMGDYFQGLDMDSDWEMGKRRAGTRVPFFCTERARETT
jgi:hypothetical protein